MRLLLLTVVLALTASPTWAATRMFFTVANSAPVAPSFDGAWDQTTGAVSRKLADTKGASAITAGSTISITEDQLAWQALDRQYVSTRMAGGVLFTSVSTTVAMQLMMREFAGTDDVDKCILSVRIVSEDGLTVRATLIGVGNYGPTLELINNATMRNKTCADGDLAQAIYVTVEGDRLVVEVGYQTDGAETTPQAAAKYGENSTDLPVNETQTTDGNGWVEFSNTITFVGELAGTKRRKPVVFQ